MITKKKITLYKFPKPMDNDCLIGHTKILNNFLNAWNNRDKYPLHPVWMLSGARGIGKATLAYKIAKMVYGNIGDFFIIDMERNIDSEGNPKPDGKVISVYTVRKMIEDMQLSSMSGEWRVILIDSVDELNMAASNALLKLLEEPPKKTLFLLIVHQLSNVLPTVRSRARLEKIQPLSISELGELCMKFMPNEEISKELLELANGSFGKLANLKKSGGDEIYEEIIEVLKNPQSTNSDIMDLASKIASFPELYDILLDVVAHFNLAELYPKTIKTIAEINKIHIEPGVSIFNIITDIKKCL